MSDPTNDALPETAMDTGSDAGTPGERLPAEPGDLVSPAVADDAPLPDGSPEVGHGTDNEDHLAPTFSDG